MSKPRKLRKWVWVGAFAFVPAVLYVGGYFALGAYTNSSGTVYRAFRSSRLAFAYLPLGWIESKIFRRTVCLQMPGRSEFENQMLRFEP